MLAKCYINLQFSCLVFQFVIVTVLNRYSSLHFIFVKNNNMINFFLKRFSGPESGILEFDWLLTRVPLVQFFPIRTGFVMDH